MTPYQWSEVSLGAEKKWLDFKVGISEKEEYN